MYYDNDWAVVVPMANEEKDFQPFIDVLRRVIDRLASGKVYIVVDTVSKDRTLEMCRELSARDPRFVTVWAPENRNSVDAYLRGLRSAWEGGHTLIIEMDAGLSHDPRAIPMFLRVLNGGTMGDSPFKRRLLSRTGTVLSNLLLGTWLYDMTSGFQGFHRDIVARIIDYPFRSTAHFYQTELRYLVRRRRIFEIPIHYQAPSPRVSSRAIRNAVTTLGYYFWQRMTFRTHFL